MRSPGTCSVMDRAAPAHLLTWLIGGLCALAFALGPGIAVASATSGGSPAPVAPTTAPAPLSPANSTAAVVAEQTAAAVAQAVQQQPVNVAIPVRILSPGDDGPVTQANVVTADAQAVNVAQTQTQAETPAPTPVQAPAQAPAAPAPAAEATQTASTQQSATAVSQSTQVAPANIYIPVSILSPGDHGPVTQVNVSTAQSIATNVTQTAAEAGAAATGQGAGAGSGAAQQAPSNVSAPVTVGGVDVGDHAPSQPWVWSWTWELDCSAGAPPPITQLAPVIAQVTGGAWQWDWTWTCAPAMGGAAHAGPAASGGQPGSAQTTTGTLPVTAAAPQQGVGAETRAQTPRPGTRRSTSASRHAAGTGGVPAGSAEAFAAGFRPFTAGGITAAGLISPGSASTHQQTRPGKPARAALRTPGRTPSTPPGPGAPTVFSA